MTATTRRRRRHSRLHPEWTTGYSSRARTNDYVIVWASLLVIFLQCKSVASFSNSTNVTSAPTAATATAKTNSSSMRILYIVTTLAEYDTGRRATRRGSDRLLNVALPVLSEGVTSMISAPYNYNVDVYLVLGYTLQPERLAIIRDRLPSCVGLEVWNDAMPLARDWGRDKDRVVPLSRALARQHRFVIKDKFLDYDFFVVFEDDMLIKGEHVSHFVNVTKEIARIREEASDEPAPTGGAKWRLDTGFYGSLRKQQLGRMIPGFVRVESLLDEKNYGTQEKLAPVPVDLEFTSNGTEVTKRVDPETCCHVSNHTTKPHLPERSESDKLFLWETDILALGVREMPKPSWLDWVAFQTGPTVADTLRDKIVGDYWAGTAFPELGITRPQGNTPKFINNQGGWMASREQIWRWHTEECEGGFLPPFDTPHYAYDGLDLRNVEWWSGGLQLAQSKHSCGLQRILVLEPEHFSKHLIYHTANNKQRQLHDRRNRFIKANTLLGQLNAVKKKAQQQKQLEKGGKQ